jgi:hypothetical protein
VTTIGTCAVNAPANGDPLGIGTVSETAIGIGMPCQKYQNWVREQPERDDGFQCTSLQTVASVVSNPYRRAK